MKWDVFISHAFEDKEFSRDLATALTKRGIRVWFDEFELHVGDSLSKSINHGLSESKYGIVILSKKFFEKEWTQKELGALTSRETLKQKVLLPIWLNIDREEIAIYSPLLADRLALTSNIGVDKIVDLIFFEIKGESLGISSKERKKRSVFEVDLEFTKKLVRDKQVELEAVVAQAREVAQTDSTTFFLNRPTILFQLNDEILRSIKQKTPLSVLLLSLDNFNDHKTKQGFWIALRILRGVANEIRNLVPKSNIIGRLFAEEFLIIMPNNAIEDANKQAKIICEYFQTHPIQINGKDFFMTFSVVSTMYKTNEEDRDNLITRAYELLLHAQANGGNQWISNNL